MKRKLFAIIMMLALVLSCSCVLSVYADAFKPSETNVVNIICSFEEGDWMPMLPDTITAQDQLNTSNFDIGLSDKNAYTGSKSYIAGCHSDEGGYATFEWYQIQNNKHIYERNGHSELVALYNSGKCLDLTNADYLQFYVKNEADKALVIKWLALIGSDSWGLKPYAKYVYIMRDGEWENLSVADSYITIPRKYEGFIRVDLRTENFKSGSWDGTTFDKSKITSICTYLHANSGGVNGNLYIDDVAFVGKNLDVGNAVCNATKIDEKTYFSKFLGTEEETVTTEAPTEVTTEPTVAPTEEPTEQPTTEPATEPVTEPVTEPATEPVTEPVTEPITEPVSEPETDPATVPETEPSQEPTQAPTAATEQAGQSEEKGGSALPVIIIVAVVLAAAGVVAFVLYKKKK